MEDAYFDSLPSLGEIQAETWEMISQLIGEYVVSFQEIEAALKEAIAYLLSCEEEAADIVCSELGFRHILKVFISLIVYRNKGVSAVPEDLNALRKRIEAASVKRNTVVHSQWIRNNVNVDSVLTFKGGNSLRSGYNGGYIDISIEELNGDITEFNSIIDDLRKWMESNFPKS